MRDRITKSLVYNEMPEDGRKDWFDYKRYKFLQHIDTYYYCVYLDADFTMQTADERVIAFRHYVDKLLSQVRAAGGEMVLELDGVPMYFTVKRSRFANVYDLLLKRADHYHIFFTRYTYNSSSPQVLVQIESKALWMDGVRRSLLESLKDVEEIALRFGFEITCALENRIDFCWHNNYFENPELFLRSDNFAKSLLTRLQESKTHEDFYGNETYEIDFRSVGKRTSNNVYFRMYNKGKEVVQKQYKPFFLRNWYLNGLISRYDLYVYEKAYEHHSWEYADKARLEFYTEYGADEQLKMQCMDILNGDVQLKYDALHGFADMLTPKLTLVMNVEYQTMRKFTATLDLEVSEHNIRRFGGCARLFEILDAWKAITNVLTGSVLRFVEPQGDENKSRRDNCRFWQLLRAAKCIDVKHYAADCHLMRTYNHEKDAEVVKKRILSGLASWNLYAKGNHEDAPELQVLDFLNALNDNDYDYINRNKRKKEMRQDYSDAFGLPELSGNYMFFDETTGEVILPQDGEEEEDD